MLLQAEVSVGPQVTQEGGSAPEVAPVSLKSADLILPKASAQVEDGSWLMGNSLNPLPSEWARNFDVLGSQPSWTFAVGQGMEAVH